MKHDSNNLAERYFVLAIKNKGKKSPIDSNSLWNECWLNFTRKTRHCYCNKNEKKQHVHFK